MGERRIENRILYLLVFILIGILLILIFGMQISIMNFKIGVNMLSPFFELLKKLSLSLVVGIAAVMYAKRTLDYSKRSSLVKDSYGPLLDDLRKNKRVTLKSAEKLDFKALKSMKDSYLYFALEKRDRKYIETIIEKENIINKNKKVVISKVKVIINKHIKQVFEKTVIKGSEIGGLIIPEGAYKYKNSYFFTKRY